MAHNATLIPLKPHQTHTRTHEIPQPAPRVRVFKGMGQGRSGDTPGLPMPITTIWTPTREFETDNKHYQGSEYQKTALSIHPVRIQQSHQNPLQTLTLALIPTEQRVLVSCRAAVVFWT